MNLKLASAADYFRTARAPKLFLIFIQQVRRVFTFKYERANRLVRFVQVAGDYKNGVMVRDIVNRYGCSNNTVMRYARMAGLPKRPKSDDPERHAKIIRLSKSKPRPSQEEIAEACNCSVALVSLVEHAADLPRYGKRPRTKVASS